VSSKAPTKIVSQEEPPLLEQPLVQSAVSTDVETKPTKRRSLKISSPNGDDFDIFINQRSADDNIHAIATLDDLQRSVKEKEKPVSIVLFYARYCPYSKRTMPDLRLWARSNQDRIVLYEADVEQASNLADHYHVRTIPTLMAFNEQNLLAPIWQRTANQVLATDLETAIVIVENEEKTIDPSQFEEIFRTKLHSSNNLVLLVDPSLKGSNRVLKVNETPNLQEQYLVILDQRGATSPESPFLIAITSKDSSVKIEDDVVSNS
jgi:thiol-disulfide isomerase/thioredoxin